MRPRLLPKQLPAFLARLRKTDRTAITSDSIVTSETTIEDISHKLTSSPLLLSADSSDMEAASSTLVKKYEIGSGANKVNVRIYKEPPTNKL